MCFFKRVETTKQEKRILPTYLVRQAVDVIMVTCAGNVHDSPSKMPGFKLLQLQSSCNYPPSPNIYHVQEKKNDGPSNQFMKFPKMLCVQIVTSIDNS